MAQHLILGEEAENLAANYLAERGMRILERRVRYAFGEIDIVGQDGGEWVFVEVKCRRVGGKYGSAAEAFTSVKSRRMFKAVERYINDHELHDSPVRCDLVAIDIEPNRPPAITHFPGGITW